MSVATALARGRAAAEALMVDTAEIRADDGGSVFDPDVGDYVVTPGTLLWSGPCRVQMQSVVPQEVAAGGAQVTLQRSELHIPVSAPDIPADSVVKITAVSATSDQALLNRKYRVLGSFAGTQKTARRLPIEATTT